MNCREYHRPSLYDWGISYKPCDPYSLSQLSFSLQPLSRVDHRSHDGWEEIDNSSASKSYMFL